MSLLRNLAIVLCLSVLFVPRAKALDTKAKVILSVAGYGAAGGALLGVASLAFGTEARAIAQGASLGLYAGLIFGTYIVVSHHYAKTNPSGEYYPEGQGLYNNLGGEPIQGQFWDDLELGNQSIRPSFNYGSPLDSSKDWDINIFQMSF